MSAPTNLHAQLVTSKDGTKIFAEALGDRSKPHLIFLHGLSSNNTVFNPLFTHPKLINDFYMVNSDILSLSQSILYF